jgi:hypothetical protein
VRADAISQAVVRSLRDVHRNDEKVALELHQRNVHGLE